MNFLVDIFQLGIYTVLWKIIRTEPLLEMMHIFIVGFGDKYFTETSQNRISYIKHPINLT